MLKEEALAPAAGTMVMPHVNAQHHQHLFCMRIDPAVDDTSGGKDNLVAEVRLLSFAEPVGTETG